MALADKSASFHGLHPFVVPTWKLDKPFLTCRKHGKHLRPPLLKIAIAEDGERNQVNGVEV